MASNKRGGSHGWPIPKPSNPVNPNPNPNPNPQPQPDGVADFWFPADEKTRTDPTKIPASVGDTTLVVQKDTGTIWRYIKGADFTRWEQIGDPYVIFRPDRSADPKVPVLIPKWSRVIDDGMSYVDEQGKKWGRTYQFPDLEERDCIEIVDTMQIFDKQPVTIIKDPEDHFGFLMGKDGYIDDKGKFVQVDGTESSINLDVTGESSVWRFSVVNGDIVAVVVPTYTERVSYG